MQPHDAVLVVGAPLKSGEVVSHQRFDGRLGARADEVERVIVTTYKRRSDPTLLRGARLFQDVLGEKVFDLGLIANDFVIGRFEKLLATIAKLLANRLLHARILQLALPSGFLADETDHAKSENLVTVGIADHQHGRVLPRLQLADRLERALVALKGRLRDEAQVAA